jgi:hypothetical protein
MIKHIIKIKHVYQDIHNPNVQTVKLDCDYATAYAFFCALIDKGKDFSVEIETGNSEV